ncbi:enoyl-CoA hydratase [Methylophaga sp. 42_25_T18]|nr:enoyl-CoA hydratase [Methylophaga sp. 42_25_T18]OUR85934.1 enoyl-CoA hydratase [Methylophaga sp. 42_8_T64]
MNALAQLKEINHDLNTDTDEQYSQIRTFSDDKYKITWCLMNGAPRLCFNPTLLRDLSLYVKNVQSEMLSSNGEKYDFLVLGSEVEGTFNLGGDLDLFYSSIQSGDRKGLYDYAVSCIDVLYQNIVHLECELITISLVQGDALGGGFETALASNVLIAERDTKMGLPEVLFNLFPGMGAFTLLSRKIGVAAAEKMILSGKLYSAEELFEMGIVDILAEPGEGELAVYKYIKRANKTPNSYKALAKVKDICNQITYQELLDITNIWVDAAFKLADKDLKMMTRLIKRQNAKS